MRGAAGNGTPNKIAAKGAKHAGTIVREEIPNPTLVLFEAAGAQYPIGTV